MEILERHPSLEPIMDFCVLGLEKQGLGEVVTCSGAYKDGSLRLFYKAISVNEDVSPLSTLQDLCYPRHKMPNKIKSL